MPKKQTPEKEAITNDVNCPSCNKPCQNNIEGYTIDDVKYPTILNKVIHKSKDGYTTESHDEQHKCEHCGEPYIIHFTN